MYYRYTPIFTYTCQNTHTEREAQSAVRQPSALSFRCCFPPRDIPALPDAHELALRRRLLQLLGFLQSTRLQDSAVALFQADQV